MRSLAVLTSAERGFTPWVMAEPATRFDPHANGVLVIDDFAPTREAVVMLLQMNGLEAVGAESGPDALDLVQAGMRPCVVLLDLRMPGMDGWETWERMKVLPDFADYNLRARTIELLMGPYSDAKVAYAEFFITNERAPSNEELLAQLGTFEGVRVEMEKGNIVLTVDSPADPELDGLSFALIPNVDATSINFMCELRSPSMAEYMPKFMCPPAYGY
jgi:CheY-like chemotaxis protein